MIFGDEDEVKEGVTPSEPPIEQEKVEAMPAEDTVGEGSAPSEVPPEVSPTITEETATAPETTPEAQPEPTSTTPTITVSHEEWSQLKAMLDSRYNDIATLLRYNKTREDTIQRLNNEVQKYREGFAFSALKPFINTLISFREECRKSEREIAQYADTDEKAKKCIDFLVDDYQQMLINIGLERNEGIITINGRPLIEPPTQKQISTPAQTDEQPSEAEATQLAQAEPISSLPQLIEYLTQTEGTIKHMIADRATVDQTVADLATVVKRTDAEHYLALVSPIVTQLYTLGDKLSELGKSTNLTLQTLYETMLALLINKIEATLINAGVQIESTFLSSSLDTQRHKIQKTVPTTEEGLDRTIAATLTDCYSFEGKVIYQSKVDVYKYQN